MRKLFCNALIIAAFTSSAWCQIIDFSDFVKIEPDGAGLVIGEHNLGGSVFISELKSGTTTEGQIKLKNSVIGDAIIIDARGSNDEPFIELLRANGAPGIRLDVDEGGDSRISTDELQINGGSDLAEGFHINASNRIEPGSVVVIDEDDIGVLKLSSQSYDKRVVGIVSGANGIEPGMLMGQAGSIADGDYPIALVGRVYVKADARQGAIKAGDFLTTSPTPGYAMKVRKRKKAQGAIIGKALTSLNDGTGYVLVLVNLQ